MLIAGGGGTAGGNGTNSAVLYNPITRSYSSTGNLVASGRRDHTAHLLTDGRVLLVGGFDSSGNPLLSLEAYDPGAGTFSSFAITGGTSGGMVNPRALHTTTALADGTLLVAGGCRTSACDTTVPDARNTAEIINVGTTSTAATGSLNAQHVSATATLTGSKVLIAGGATSKGGNGTSYAELFSGGTFSCPGTSCGGSRVAMNVAREAHGAILLPNGQVALIGGRNGTGTAVASIELFDPTLNGSFNSNAATLSAARFQLQATPLVGAGRILVSGGFTSGTTGSTALDLFDVSGTTLTAVSPIDLLTTARGGHTATLLFGGTALLSGGTSSASGELFSSAQ